MSAAADAVDVIVVNYRSAGDTLGALAALGAPPGVRVIVVDNSADAGEAAALSAGVAGAAHVQLIVADSNLGFGAGCNLAFGSCSAPFVLLLNPDARIDAAALARLQQTLRQRPTLGAVSPRTDWTQDGRFVLPLPEAQGPGQRLRTAIFGRLSAWGWDAEAAWAEREVRRCRELMQRADAFEVRSLAGALLLLRREAVLRAGGLFDPRYFMFFEDTDLSLRLRRAGYALAIDSGARGVHGWRNGAHKWALMAAAEQQFLRRHHPWLERWWPRWARWGALGRGWERRGPDLGTFANATDFNRAAPAGIHAISPVPWMCPAAVRPDADALPVSECEWHLLEPGRYVARLGGAGGWASFVVEEARA